MATRKEAQLAEDEAFLRDSINDSLTDALDCQGLWVAVLRQAIKDSKRFSAKKFNQYHLERDLLESANWLSALNSDARLVISMAGIDDSVLPKIQAYGLEALND